MTINVRETVRHALKKNTCCSAFHNGMGLETWDFVSERAKITEDELLSLKYFETLDEMIKEEGVYIDLVPNDDICFKLNGEKIQIFQTLELRDGIIEYGPIDIETEDFIDLIRLLTDTYEGHYGITLKENEDGEIEVGYGEIGPANPSGHCPPAFYPTNDETIIELLENSIVYEEDLE